MHKFLPTLMALGFTAYCGAAMAAELPPTNSVDLASLVTAAEKQTDKTAVKAEFEEGLWEITTCGPNDCDRLYMEPITGKIRRQSIKPGHSKQPADTDVSLNQLVGILLDSGHADIMEIKYKSKHGGYWEAEIWDGRHKQELEFSAADGSPLR